MDKIFTGCCILFWFAIGLTWLVTTVGSGLFLVVFPILKLCGLFIAIPGWWWLVALVAFVICIALFVIATLNMDWR
jgi:divalent metal cation (Fe/Co/Zn/Cd) transporter